MKTELFVVDLTQADEKGKKSKERLEEEKHAILKQRIRPLDIDGADAARLAEKAKELHSLVARLEGEKYDLEKNYKSRQMEVRVVYFALYDVLYGIGVKNVELKIKKR